MKTDFTDYHGTPIEVGDTVINFRLNFIEPKIWIVKRRSDGLIYCEGEYQGMKKYIGLEQLINTSGVALKVFNK